VVVISVVGEEPQSLNQIKYNQDNKLHIRKNETNPKQMWAMSSAEAGCGCGKSTSNRFSGFLAYPAPKRTESAGAVSKVRPRRGSHGFPISMIALT
jgi:hypothetical protein